LQSGIIAVSQEIYAEMEHIQGSVGQCIKDHKADLLMEVGDNWDWGTYIDHVNAMEDAHHDFISEYCGGSKKPCLNDISIIALAKTLDVVSMEEKATGGSKKLNIPDVCDLEGIEHLRFSEFLRREKLRF